MTDEQSSKRGLTFGMLAVVSLFLTLFTSSGHQGAAVGMVFISAYIAAVIFSIAAGFLHSKWWLVLSALVILAAIALLVFLSNGTFSM